MDLAHMDRRQRKTHHAIYQAFEELLAENHYATITVAQIIERADVGRSTFYAHFSTKDELLEEMCTELFAHVFEGVETDAHTHQQLETTSLEGTLAHLLCHLRDSHHGVCGKLLAEGEPHFTAYFQTELEAFFAPRMPARSNWVPRDLLQALLVRSFSEAAGWWRAHGYDTPADQLAHWYARTMGWEALKRDQGAQG